MKLNEICEVYSGYALKSFNDVADGLPVVKIGNILTDGTLNLEECQYTTDIVNEKYYSNKGDIYIALSGATTGKIGIMNTDDKYIINQRVGIVRQKSKDIPQEYIKYFLLRETDRILQDAMGCAQPNISPKRIAEYIVPDISKEDMRKVCEILNKIKGIIDSRKKEIIHFDELVRGRFVELFGDIISNEKGWETDIWSNVLKIVNGKNQKAVESEDGEYLICGSGGAMGRATEYLTNENSVIIGRKGSINKPLLMREKYWNVDTAFGIEPNTKYINVDYLYMFCVFFNFEKLNKAVTIPSLTKTDLLNIEMPIPNILLQNQFADFVHQIDKSKLIVQKELDETQLLFDSLMQEYFG